MQFLIAVNLVIPPSFMPKFLELVIGNIIREKLSFVHIGIVLDKAFESCPCFVDLSFIVSIRYPDYVGRTFWLSFLARLDGYRVQ
jgi:hypothetical protein